MKVNSAKEYRRWLKLQENRPEVIEDFIGCSHDNNGQKIKGFLNLFHGIRGVPLKLGRVKY